MVWSSIPDMLALIATVFDFRHTAIVFIENRYGVVMNVSHFVDVFAVCLQWCILFEIFSFLFIIACRTTGAVYHIGRLCGPFVVTSCAFVPKFFASALIVVYNDDAITVKLLDFFSI